MIRSSKQWLIYFFLLLQLGAGAQNFLWKSNLDPVPSTGFYAIPLSLDLQARVKADLSDIRIKDEKNKAVPYLVKKPSTDTHSSFINFPVLKNTTDSISTTVDIDVSAHADNDHLYLVIANNAVERFTSLSGSNDGKQWFIINEKLPLTKNGNDASDHFIQKLNFPLIRYRHLRLIINNGRTYPLQILNIGVYTGATTNAPQLYTHPGTTWLQKDSADRNSYVFISNPQAYPVDRIRMDIAAPKFYNRSVNVYRTNNGLRPDFISTTTLRAGNDTAIWIAAGKAKELLLVIENGDNPPLNIAAVQTQSRKQQLVAWLEKGRAYTLFGGNDSLLSPGYDLALFSDSIPEQPSLLNHGPALANQNVVADSDTENANWWLWPSIIAALVVLAFLTYRLTNDIKSKA